MYPIMLISNSDDGMRALSSYKYALHCTILLSFCLPSNTVCVEIFAFFAMFPFSQKLCMHQNKTHMNLSRKYELYRKNYHDVKGLANISV